GPPPPPHPPGPPRPAPPPRPPPAPPHLRKLVLDVRGRIQGDRPAVVALFTTANDRPLTVIATNEAARERGLKAGDLVRTAAKTLGGGGGGKPDVAQGGGQNPGAIPEAISAVERLVVETV
ncbi:DHHA1 domain-containing protein, partial [Streptomyces sp. NPDC059552]|uniref:DHHA1 domain-containing protein n=1 Tax=Streptomyces sp. NPDC059552 TaxID=3346862 RepID=UPI003690D435